MQRPLCIESCPHQGDPPGPCTHTPEGSVLEEIWWEGWWLLVARALNPWWSNEAMPCAEAKAREKGPKVCGVPEIHVDVGPGRRNLVNWALKGQNSH